MRVVASSSGFEVVEDGHLLLFFDRDGRGSAIAMVVAFGFAALLGVHAVLWTSLAIAGQSHWALGPVFAVGAIIPTVVGALVRRRFRRLRTRPLSELRPLVVVDVGARWLLSSSLQPIAPVTQCRAAQAMLISSSAPSVRITWPGGGLEVYRGGLFGGGIADVLALLHRAGMR